MQEKYKPSSRPGFPGTGTAAAGTKTKTGKSPGHTCRLPDAPASRPHYAIKNSTGANFPPSTGSAGICSHRSSSVAYTERKSV